MMMTMMLFVVVSYVFHPLNPKFALMSTWTPACEERDEYADEFFDMDDPEEENLRQ
jgi:hypothetical protein